jgi:RHS repeat-associated protein
MLTDIGGTVVNTMVYDAYGNLIASNYVLQTAYLYSGQQFDFDLGFYYNRARYLNTTTSRFWTSDTTDGNNEDPLSLHKYLYAEDNPIDNVDPLGLAASSTSGNNPAAMFGNAVEEKIMADFRTKFGRYAFTDKSILASLGLLGKAQLLQQALPDLVNTKQKSIFEIKPNKPKKILEGVAKLASYWATFKAIDPKGGWHPGSIQEYIPPLEVTVSVPPFFAVVTPPVLGLITYSSLQDYVKSQANTVDTEEEADTEDTEGVAALDSELGAP